MFQDVLRLDVDALEVLLRVHERVDRDPARDVHPPLRRQVVADDGAVEAADQPPGDPGLPADLGGESIRGVPVIDVDGVEPVGARGCTTDEALVVGVEQDQAGVVAAVLVARVQVERTDQ